MKLTLSPSRDQSAAQHPCSTVTVEVPQDDLCIDEIVSMFSSLLLAAGYDPKNVKDYLGED